MTATGAVGHPVQQSRVRDVLSQASSIGPLDLALSIWVLFTFAIAQPLLDLVGRNPEFFLARAAPPVDIVLVGLIFIVAIPGLLALIVIALRAAYRQLGVVVHAALFTAMTAALVVSVLERLPWGAVVGWVEMAIGLLLGALLWFGYLGLGLLRSAFRFASIGPPVFLVMFLVISPTSDLLTTSGSVGRPAGVEVGSPSPVVMIVFDEFPVASLIDSSGNLIDEAYPNFARLAREGTWFRNAMAVEQQTEQALPTILTGRQPSDREAIPMTADYPLSLFSLLSDAYDIRAVEAVTELCPEYACQNRSRVVAPTADRWRATIADLSIVTAHLLLPSDVGEDLPSIANTWGDFASATPEARDEFNIVTRFNEHVEADRRSEIHRFLDLLRTPTSQPTLYFAHVLLPHIPWSYLDTGQRYYTHGRAPGSTPTGWGPDEWLVMQAQQRYLLQVRYTDLIIGEIIATLEETGIYEEALMVVLADHGTADIPNVVHRRVITPDTVGHIAAIPLFVKLPGMTKTGVDDYRAETIDVLPTIADVLDLEIPWTVDGTSLVATTRPERPTTTMRGTRGDVTFDDDGEEKLAIARWREVWFDSGDPFSLVPHGFGHLLGVPLDDLEVVDDQSLSIRVNNATRYQDLDLRSDPFPAQITGSLVRTTNSPTGDVVLAIAVNGTVQAVVRTYNEDGSTSFQAMLPIWAFQTGANHVEIVLVDDSGAELAFHRPTG